MKKRNNVKKLVIIAMFVALAYVLEFAFRIKVSFLTFDVKDAVLAIASMIYGPLSAVMMSVVIGILEFISVSDTGFWGMLMNICSSMAFTVTASLIYKYKKTFVGAIVALVSSIIVTTAIMMPANLLITPIYTGTDIGTVASLIPTLLLPFNFAKAVFNAAIVLILYKPVTTALKKAKLIESSPMAHKYKLDKNTLIMLLIAAVLLTVSIILLVSMGAKVDFGASAS